MTVSLRMLPASDGDCLILSWKHQEAIRTLAIDLGRTATWPAARDALAGHDHIDLLVLTHVDADHIEGATAMFDDAELALHPAEVWFNGWQQLDSARRRSSLETFGAKQGEKVSEGIDANGWPLNVAFQSGVVSTGSPEASGWIEFGNGLRILLLSPDDSALASLLPRWNAELAAAGILPFGSIDDLSAHQGLERLGILPDVSALASTPYEADRAVANRSSIAFVAEVEGKRILFAGDAGSELLERSLIPLAQEDGGRARLDLVKVSHHGARSNTSPRFLDMIDCGRFAFSTDGSRGHGHPHPETVARLLAANPTRQKALHFNYRSASALRWGNPSLKRKWKYDALYCDPDHEGTLEIVLD